MATLWPHTLQYISIGFSEHVWPLARVVIDVGGEGEQELETKSVNKDTTMLRSFLQKTPESTFSKLEIGLI